jgi:hypothetical protein
MAQTRLGVCPSKSTPSLAGGTANQPYSRGVHMSTVNRRPSSNRGTGTERPGSGRSGAPAYRPARFALLVRVSLP